MPLADDLGEIWDRIGAWHLEAGAKVVPEGDAEFPAGLHEAEEGILGLLSGLGAGAAGDLAPRDLTADVVLRAVGVEGDLGAVEDDQQLLLVGLETGQQAVQGGVAGAGRKERLEAPDELGSSSAAGRGLVVLEVGIEPPEALLNARLGLPLGLGDRIKFLDQPLGMDPAKGVGGDVELARAAPAAPQHR